MLYLDWTTPSSSSSSQRLICCLDEIFTSWHADILNPQKPTSTFRHYIFLFSPNLLSQKAWMRWYECSNFVVTLRLNTEYVICFTSTEFIEDNKMVNNEQWLDIKQKGFSWPNCIIMAILIAFSGTMHWETAIRKTILDFSHEKKKKDNVFFSF